MSIHRATKRARRRRFSSVRIRALLGLGVALGIGATGTFAYWTDDVTITGSSFTAGTLDLRVNDVDGYATTMLSMPSMVPGNTSAEVLTVKNFGTAALKYSMVGGQTGTDATAYSAAAALKLSIVSGGAKNGTGSSSTCTGGTTIVNAVALTGTTTTLIIPKRGPLATTGTEALCFQVTFDAAAPTALQGTTATATFTVTGTSDLS
jgi:predicted ribosomally synthesized peptide with SipW-like signal peptide